MLTSAPVLRVWAPQQGKPFAFEGHPNPYLSLLFPYALQQPVLFESIVALCRVSWLLENGIDTTQDRAFLYHHGSTRDGLQKRLSSDDTAADDTTLLTVAALSTIDYSLGRHITADMYLRNMRHIVERRGGLRYESPWQVFVSSMIAAFESLWTFILANHPQPGPELPPLPSQSYLSNEIPVYANHPFPPEYTLALAKVPKAFSELAVSGVLSMQVIRIIGRIPPEIMIPQVPTGLDQTSILYKVLTDLLRLVTLAVMKMEHVLCAALIAFSVPLTYGIPLPESITPTLKICVDTYMSHLPHADEMDRNCTIWCAMVIASAVEMSSHNSDLYKGVFDQALSKYREAREWKSLERILRQFLWHDDLVRYWQLTTWKGAMDRRLTAMSSASSSPPAQSRDGRTPPSRRRAIPIDSILN